MDIRDNVRSHHNRFDILYGTQDFSDHGPMAASALLGLGATDARVDAYLEQYRKRLRPFDAAPPAYRRLLDVYLRHIATEGAEAVLAAVLPEFISGWARHAFHPAIRLAYGFEFQFDEEIAAGLAYLHFCGPDPAVDALASTAVRSDTSPCQLFGSMRQFAVADAPTFDSGLNTVLQSPDLGGCAVVLEDNLDRMTREALDVFASTHDFFALHLLTGAYAFRLLQPFAGPNASALLNLGLLLSYAAIGAPEYGPAHVQFQQSIDARPPDWIALAGEDEHHIKIAYSASQLTALQQDDSFARVAMDYLLRSRSPDA